MSPKKVLRKKVATSKARPAGRKINITKNYRLFSVGNENRALCMKKHKKLMQSMKDYGYLACFPIICFRDKDKHLVVKDGQHRLAIAETLGLPVYWVEDSVDFDVAVINSTSKVWGTVDYAEKYSANNLKDYTEGLDFMKAHRLPVSTAFCLLAGHSTFGNITTAFRDGRYKIKDRGYADAVAGLYGAMVLESKNLKTNKFLTACMAACRVQEFNPDRLIQGAKRQREKLVSYSTRDAYLDMMEEVYNYNRKSLLGLKAAATMAMRDRSAANNKPQ